jgi:hypothetical protein
MHMVTHRSRDTDAARGAFCLDSDRHIDRVAVKVGSIRDRIANVDPDPKADSAIMRLATIKARKILLHLDCEAYRPIDAVEYHQQGIAAGLNNSAAMPVEGRIDNTAPELAQPVESLQVVQHYQAAVPNPVGINDRDKSPWIRQPTDPVRYIGHRHGGYRTGNAAGLSAIHKPPERHPSTGGASADTWSSSSAQARTRIRLTQVVDRRIISHKGLVIEAVGGGPCQELLFLR